MNLAAQLLAVLVVTGFVHPFWWLVAIAVCVCFHAPKVWAAHEARVAQEQARAAAIIKRCDQQHAWVLAGDLRGTYGANYEREPS